MADKDTYRLGYWSAVLVLTWVIVFGLCMVLGLFGVSSGQLSFLAGLLLAPSFIGLMAAIHQQTAAPKRIWSLLGLEFAVIYAVLVDIVYYIQLTVTRTTVGGAANGLAGAAASGASVIALQQFVFTPGTAVFALDMLGYAFMCLATWAAAYSFTGKDGLSTWIKRLFILHGVLVFPTILAPAMMAGTGAGGRAGGAVGGAAGAAGAAASGAGDKLGYFALLFWCAIFIPLTLTVMRHFRLKMRAGGEVEA